MSNTVNTYDYSPYWLQTSNSNAADTSIISTAPNASTASVFDEAKSQSAANTNNSVLSDGCDDGKDDGKIGIWSGICAFGKGVVKSAVNTVVGIVTDPKKAIATVATAAVCVAFPPAGVALGVAGAVGGAISLAGSAKTAYDIYNKGGTDAEMKAAIQDAGASTLQIGLSVAGTKASFNAMKGTAGSAMNNLKPKAGFKATAEAFWKDLKTGGKGNGGDGYLATRAFNQVKTNVKNEGPIKGVQKTASDGFNKVKTSMENRAAQKEYNKYEKMDAEGQKNLLKEMSDDIDKAKTQQTEAQAAVDNLKANGANAKDASTELKTEFEIANNKLNSANKKLASAEARQTNFENAKTAKSVVQDNYLEAKSALEKAQEAVNKAGENGGKATEAQLQALNEAKANLNSAKADMRLASSNPITYNAQRFADTASAAGYNSGFGVLTAPVAAQNMIINASDMTLETAQCNAALNNNTFGNVTTSNSRTFDTQFEQRDYAAMAEQANADVMKTLNYYAY